MTVQFDYASVQSHYALVQCCYGTPPPKFPPWDPGVTAGQGPNAATPLRAVEGGRLAAGCLASPYHADGGAHAATSGGRLCRRTVGVDHKKRDVSRRQNDHEV